MYKLSLKGCFFVVLIRGLVEEARYLWNSWKIHPKKEMATHLN